MHPRAPKIVKVLFFLPILCLISLWHKRPYLKTCCGCHRGKGQRVIAFSVFGRNEVYLDGLLRNAKAIESIYSTNYTMRVYSNESIEELSQLQILGNVDICYVSDLDLNQIFAPDLPPTIWRFLSMIDPLVDEFHSRDLDSLPSLREKAAVDEFLADDQSQFHIMRDHKLHSSPILAGMWGAKPSLNLDFATTLLLRLIKASKQVEKSHGKVADQALLSRFIFPYIEGRVLVHDSYHCGSFNVHLTKAFPTQRNMEKSPNFVGAVYDEHSGLSEHICPPPCRPPDHQDWIYC